MSREVIIIGGGPAGMMAAYTAASSGKTVLLFDKNAVLGRKLRITGKGRCNITNDCDQNTLMQNIPRNGKFLYSAFSGFGTAEVVRFFEEKGVPVKTERGGRVFPVSDKAHDVAAALEEACKAAGVLIRKDTVTEIYVDDGTVTGVKTQTGHFTSDAVILASGGKSYSATGSDGSGYALAKKCGHTITDIRPSLIPIVSKDEACADMQGLSLKNVELSLWDSMSNGKKPIYKELGEMLFTHFGMSGPLVLSASAHIERFEEGRFYVSIDLKPGLSEQQLDARILRDFDKYKNRDFVNSLEELLPRKMIPIIVQRSEIPPLCKVNSVTKEQRKSLVQLLKGFTVSVDGFRPIEEAIITSGGIAINEVNPKTMESKLVRNLFFAGEILDVDGYTGGFNLQIAFSTGYTAGKSC